MKKGVDERTDSHDVGKGGRREVGGGGVKKGVRVDEKRID